MQDADLPYLAALKVGLQFKRRFWEEDEQIYGGITYTSLASTTISYPMWDYFSKGKGVVKAYQKCRRSRGYMGKCGGAAGYSCSRRILDKNSVTYDAKVTCKKGHKRVVHTYQQNK